MCYTVEAIFFCTIWMLILLKENPIIASLLERKDDRKWHEKKNKKNLTLESGNRFQKPANSNSVSGGPSRTTHNLFLSLNYTEEENRKSMIVMDWGGKIKENTHNLLNFYCQVWPNLEY